MAHFKLHALVLCILAIVQLTGLHNALENCLSDLRSLWSPRAATGDIVLVAIDSQSLAKIGVWPWPRTVHAQLLDRLESAGVADVVFAIDFSAPSNPESDNAFAAALERAGGSVILPSFKQFLGTTGRNGIVHLNRPLPQFADHAWSAVVNVEVGPDGLVRRFPFGDMLDGTYVPSAAALLAGRHFDSRGSISLDFSIRPESIVTISYLDILNGDQAALDKLKNRKAVIGGTANELGDRFNISHGRVISGAMLQILATETILQDRGLTDSSGWLNILGVSLIVFLMVMVWSQLTASRRFLILVSISVLTEFVALLLQAELCFVLDTSLFHTVIAGYLVVLALDELNFRGVVGDIAESRFRRIAMSLGDGLACTDKNGLVTIWNPGAVAIFGYEPEEMIGEPLGKVCLTTDVTGMPTTFSLLDLPQAALQSPGGKLAELAGRRKNGETFSLEACFSSWKCSDGYQYGAVLRDISVRKREVERIRYLAKCDALTGLANRNTLNEHLGVKIENAVMDGSQIALLVMDIDKFKQVNDTLGHTFGDCLLRAFAKKLTSLVDNSTLVCRLGGDEFAIVIAGMDIAASVREIGARIRDDFARTPLRVDEHKFDINVRMGSAIFPTDCKTPEELVCNADLALYQVKIAGRGRHVSFVKGIRDAFEARLSVETGLARGSENEEFELFYQPQVNLMDGKLAGAEALIRWRHPERGLVLPADFMPIANACAVSQHIALWVMRSACQQAHLWERQGHCVRIGVNLSPSQLLTDDLATTVETILHDTGLTPSLLELEVTENILLADDDKAIEIFARIQELGVHIAFDDFGTGFASLTYLKKFPFGTLKIDRSFVRELRVNPDDAVIVRSTIGLGKMLGLSVIAEGIEDRATADLLRSMGCEEGQGYFFGHPMPAAEFERTYFSNTDAAAKEIYLPMKETAVAA